MLKNKQIYKLLIIIILLLSAKIGFSQLQDDNIRAMLIFNVAEKIIWPNEESITTITIGVYSANPNAYNAILAIAATKQIKGKKVKIIYFKKYNKITETHILFLANNKNEEIARINNLLEGKNTLLITDRLEEKDNSMINLLTVGGKKSIEVDNKNITSHNLKADKSLILHGGNEAELKLLISETVEELEKQKENLTASIEENKKQKKDIEKQKNDILAQSKKIKTQKNELSTLIEDLKKQKNKLDENMEVLINQETLIKKKQIEFRAKQRELKQKEKEFKVIEEDTRKKQEELKKIEDKLKDANLTISEDKNVISEAHEQIATQKSIIIIVIGFLAFVILAIIMFWRALRINKRINKELNHKNDEINQQNEEIQAQAMQLESNNKELEKLSIVAGKAQNGIMIMDEKGNFEWVNAGFTKMYGYTLQLLINELDENILTASHDPEIKKHIENCITKKEHVTYEVENIKRNGEKIWVKTTITPILDEENNVKRLVSIDTDITKVKRAEQEIRKQHKKISRQNIELEKLSIVARETDNAVIIMDSKGNFEWVNHAFTNIFGFTYEELVKKDANIIGKNTDKETLDIINQTLIHKKTSTYQLKAASKERKDIWIQATLTPILDKDGNITKIIGVDSNITKIKEAELEILEKNEELEQQKEKIEFQNQQIHSSINYAQTIQASILPYKTEMDKHFDSFVVFLPKDVVSGDFYWFTHINEENKTFVAAVDCTGHGVPGAFMSMIASRLLNEIVNEKKIYAPKDILSLMDSGVIKALRQKTSSNNDGLDMSLSLIERIDNECKISYGGAKRPLFLSKDNQDIKKIKGTRRSIGGVKRIKNKAEFETKQFTLSKGDTFYLTSDGYSDQNDPQRKRYGSPSFIKLLNRIKDLSMEKQKEQMEIELFKHMKDAEQRDDITVIGIRV